MACVNDAKGLQRQHLLPGQRGAIELLGGDPHTPSEPPSTADPPECVKNGLCRKVHPLGMGTRS